MPQRRPTETSRGGEAGSWWPPLRLRYVLAGAGLLALGVWGAARVDALGTWLDRQLPVRRILVEDALEREEPRTLARWIGQRLRGGILAADLEALRQGLTDRPWVRTARLRRRWPDALEVRVAEHAPAAMWRPATGAQWHLVSRRGVVFKRHRSGDPVDLPRLQGPRSRLGELRRRRAALDQRLGPGHGVTRMAVSSRGAWSGQVDGRVTLRFGRVHWRERIGRLVQVQRKWRLLGPRVKRVDLRYPDGLAVAVSGGVKIPMGAGQTGGGSGRMAARM